MKIFLLFLYLVFPADKQKTGAEIKNDYNNALRLYEAFSKTEKPKPPFRPKSCSFLSNKGEDLYKKFKGIEEGLSAACVGSNKEALTVLTTSINDLNELRKDYQSDQTGEDLSKDPPLPKKPADNAPKSEWDTYNKLNDERDARIRRRGIEDVIQKTLTHAVTSVADLTDDKDCTESIKATKVINLIADVISDVSSVGRFIPNTQGYAVATGGAILGSTLKILNILLAAKFNWKDREGRDLFLKMNCSFFDLKKELDDIGMFHFKLEEHRTELESKKRAVNALTPILKTLQQNERFLLGRKKLVHKAIIYNKMGAESYTLLMHINEAKELIAVKGPHVTTVEGKVIFLKQLYELHKQIFNLLNLADIGKWGRRYYLESTKNEFIGLLKGAMDEDQFVQSFLLNNENYKSLLERFLTPILWVYDYLQDKESSAFRKYRTNLQALTLDPLFKHKLLIRKYENLIENYNARIKFINNLDDEVVFSPDDEGTRIKTNIIENFRSIENKLYGKVGYSFMKFITDQVNEDFHDKNLSRFFMKNFEYVPKNLSEKDRMEYCANAKRLQLLWNSSHALLNLGYDWIEINKDSFYQPKRRLKFFAFIPYRRSDQEYIFRHAKTALDANDMLKRKDLDYLKLPTESFGRKMVKLEYLKPKLTNVQEFIDKYNCAK